jgi:hypothetical protein
VNDRIGQRTIGEFGFVKSKCMDCDDHT